MANYTNLANSLTKESTNLNSDVTNINTLLTTLKVVYTGASETKLSRDINTSLTDLKGVIDKTNALANTLKLIEEHNSSVRTLNSYESQKSSWSPDINNPNESNPYTSKVEAWNRKVKNLEKEIRSSLPQVTKITNVTNLIKPTIDFSYKDYTKKASTAISSVSGLKAYSSVTYQELLAKATSEWLGGFKNNSYGLKTSTLAKCGYTAEEIDNIIKARFVGATPRERAVISALTVIELGLDKGIKSNYELSTNFFNSVSKPYDTNTLINHGADCASYLSWALNESSDSTFNNASTKTLRNQGVKTSYDNLQPGDIIYNSSHVAMVIENNINGNDGNIVVADASHYDTGGYPDGIRLQKVSYNSLKSNDFTGYNMDNFYAQSV